MAKMISVAVIVLLLFFSCSSAGASTTSTTETCLQYPLSYQIYSIIPVQAQILQVQPIQIVPVQIQPQIQPIIVQPQPVIPVQPKMTPVTLYRWGILGHRLIPRTWYLPTVPTVPVQIAPAITQQPIELPGQTPQQP